MFTLDLVVEQLRPVAVYRWTYMLGMIEQRDSLAKKAVAQRTSVSLLLNLLINKFKSIRYINMALQCNKKTVTQVSSPIFQGSNFDYSAFFDALVRNFISTYTSAYELSANSTTIAASRHP